jgi:hypothetical protein
MTEIFNRDNFAAALETEFRLTALENGSVTIELSEVTDAVEKTGTRSFSLIFTVPDGYKVEQGLYDLSHETLGAMQLFLVPVGSVKGRQQLQAVFNFLVDND